MSAIHGARKKLLLHFLPARHPWRGAEKCSCIFGMSAIHGRQKKARPEPGESQGETV
jgi:hypothetical protein